MTEFLMSLPENVRGVLIDMVNQEMRAGGKYDPFTGDNVWEAMAEAKQQQYDQLAAILRSGDPVAVTAAVHLICREYWFDYGCRAMVHEVEEALANGDDYNPAAMEPWERNLPANLVYQAH